MSLFILKNIVHSYPESPVPALKGVSLELAKNENAALIGHVGSGKSTLLKLLVGLLRPSGGEIIFDGGKMPLKGEKLRKLRRRVGIVFQFAEAQVFETSVIREAAFGLENFDFPQEEVNKLAAEALKMVNLPPEKFGEKSPFRLSGGERKRLALASILATQPELLLMDEPAAGLDSDGRRILKDILLHRTEKGEGFIISTHDLDFAAETCRRVMILYGGELVYDGNREIFYDINRMSDWGLKPPEIVRYWTEYMKAGIAPSVKVYSLEEAQKAFYKDH